MVAEAIKNYNPTYVSWFLTETIKNSTKNAVTANLKDASTDFEIVETLREKNLIAEAKDFWEMNNAVENTIRLYAQDITSVLESNNKPRYTSSVKTPVFYMPSWIDLIKYLYTNDGECQNIGQDADGDIAIQAESWESALVTEIPENSEVYILDTEMVINTAAGNDQCEKRHRVYIPAYGGEAVNGESAKHFWIHDLDLGEVQSSSQWRMYDPLSPEEVMERLWNIWKDNIKKHIDYMSDKKADAVAPVPYVWWGTSIWKNTKKGWVAVLHNLAERLWIKKTDTISEYLYSIANGGWPDCTWLPYGVCDGWIPRDTDNYDEFGESISLWFDEREKLNKKTISQRVERMTKELEPLDVIVINTHLMVVIEHEWERYIIESAGGVRKKNEDWSIDFTRYGHGWVWIVPLEVWLKRLMTPIKRWYSYNMWRSRCVTSWAELDGDSFMVKRWYTSYTHAMELLHGDGVVV